MEIVLNASHPSGQESLLISKNHLVSVSRVRARILFRPLQIMCVRRGWAENWMDVLEHVVSQSRACLLSPLNSRLHVYLYARLLEIRIKQGLELLVGYITLKLSI
jgi:hypothetical protein